MSATNPRILFSQSRNSPSCCMTRRPVTIAADHAGATRHGAGVVAGRLLCGAGVAGGLFRRGCRSWCICFSYEIFVPNFAPVRNNPSAVRGRTGRGRRCGRCGRGTPRRGGVLVEGLVCGLHGGRVTGELAGWGKGLVSGWGGGYFSVPHLQTFTQLIGL